MRSFNGGSISGGNPGGTSVRSLNGGNFSSRSSLSGVAGSGGSSLGRAGSPADGNRANFTMQHAFSGKANQFSSGNSSLSAGQGNFNRLSTNQSGFNGRGQASNSLASSGLGSSSRSSALERSGQFGNARQSQFLANHSGSFGGNKPNGGQPGNIQNSWRGQSNHNGQGKGDWTGNGGGNWNGSGHGKGPWNGDGKGNWNGNGNWHANGNGNWNGGNWNGHNGGNWNGHNGGNWNHNHNRSNFYFGFGFPLWSWYWPNYYGYGYGSPYGYNSYGYNYWGSPYYGYNAYCSYPSYSGIGVSTIAGYAPTVAVDQQQVAVADQQVAQEPAAANAGGDASAQQFAAEGELDFKTGDYEGAVHSWRHAIVDDPNNGTLVMMMAQALFATGKFDEAAGAAQQAMMMLPEDQWGVVVGNYNELYSNVGDYTKQLRALEKAVKDKADSPALRFLVGFQYGYLGYPEDALRQLAKAKEFAPQDELAKKLYGVMEAKTKKPTNDKPTPSADKTPAETTPADKGTT